jgi:hypothetical protein
MIIRCRFVAGFDGTRQLTATQKTSDRQQKFLCSDHELTGDHGLGAERAVSVDGLVAGLGP